jgi:alpha-1,6-mannosyltransferase
MQVSCFCNAMTDIPRALDASTALNAPRVPAQRRDPEHEIMRAGTVADTNPCAFASQRAGNSTQPVPRSRDASFYAETPFSHGDNQTLQRAVQSVLTLRIAMKIVDLCEFYSSRGGGVRSYLTRMGEAASARGHELVVIAPGARNEERHEGGARIVQYAGPRMPYDPTYHAPLRVDRMRALVERECPDVLQVSSPFLPALVARTLFVPLAVYVHHSDPIGCYLRPKAAKLPSRLGRALLAPAWAALRSVCRSMDATVTAGTWLTELLTEHGCPRVHTVPFGIAHERFGPALKSDALRRRLLGPLADVDGAKLLLVTGRLATDKRQHLLVDAAHTLARERPIALVVLGDGPERARLEKRACGLPHVSFLPFLADRDEYARLLASVDLLLHGSACETFGFVLAETLASGTPVVVPDQGAAPHMMNAACGAIYPADAGGDAIAAAAGRVLSADPSALAAAAIAESRRHPSVTGHFDALFTLYGQLLGGSGGNA